MDRRWKKNLVTIADRGWQARYPDNPYDAPLYFSSVQKPRPPQSMQSMQSTMAAPFPMQGGVRNRSPGFFRFPTRHAASANPLNPNMYLPRRSSHTDFPIVVPPVVSPSQPSGAASYSSSHRSSSGRSSRYRAGASASDDQVGTASGALPRQGSDTHSGNRLRHRAPDVSGHGWERRRDENEIEEEPYGHQSRGRDTGRQHRESSSSHRQHRSRSGDGRAVRLAYPPELIPSSHASTSRTHRPPPSSVDLDSHHLSAITERPESMLGSPRSQASRPLSRQGLMEGPPEAWVPFAPFHVDVFESRVRNLPALLIGRGMRAINWQNFLLVSCSANGIGSLAHIHIVSNLRWHGVEVGRQMVACRPQPAQLWRRSQIGTRATFLATVLRLSSESGRQLTAWSTTASSSTTPSMEFTSPSDASILLWHLLRIHVWSSFLIHRHGTSDIAGSGHSLGPSLQFHRVHLARRRAELSHLQLPSQGVIQARTSMLRANARSLGSSPLECSPQRLRSTGLACRS
jgi:hypothetical protein